MQFTFKNLNSNVTSNGLVHFWCIVTCLVTCKPGHTKKSVFLFNQYRVTTRTKLFVIIGVYGLKTTPINNFKKSVCMKTYYLTKLPLSVMQHYSCDTCKQQHSRSFNGVVPVYNTKTGHLTV